MEYISRKLLSELIESESASPVVTIYAPMHTTASPPHVSENQIRFKNLMGDAIDQLELYEDGKKLASELRQKRDALRDDIEFWKNQTAGLLICAAEGNVRMFHLPIDTEEYVAVDDKFHLAWILGIINDDQDYYVLSLAQHGPKLYKGNMFGLQPSDLVLPDTPELAFGLDETNQKSENQGSATGSSMNTGWFNGRGGSRNPEETQRMQFFRLIDSFVARHVKGNPTLILAGIDSEAVEYKSISKYPKICRATITGNHTSTQAHELFAKAREIIQHEIIGPTHQAAIEEFESTKGATPDKAATDNKSITEAAEQGRVDKLLVRMSRETSDTIRDRLHRVTRITFPEPEARKHLNDLAAKVWQMSGSVIGLPANQMPNGASMVAKLRY